MKLTKTKLILIFAIFFIVFIYPQNQDSSENNEFDTISQILFNFEPDENYSIEGSPFIIEENLKSNFYPNVPLFLNNEELSENSFGVRASWDRISGNNYVDIVPENIPETRGTLSRIAIWIWGNETDAEFTAIFTRGDGTSYVASLGILDFKGWQRKVADLPNYVFKTDFNQDPLRAYKFDRFRILLDHTKSKVTNLYFFIDQLVLSEQVPLINYDGFEIEGIIKKEIEEERQESSQ